MDASKQYKITLRIDGDGDWRWTVSDPEGSRFKTLETGYARTELYAREAAETYIDNLIKRGTSLDPPSGERDGGR